MLSPAEFFGVFGKQARIGNLHSAVVIVDCRIRCPFKCGLPLVQYYDCTFYSMIGCFEQVQNFLGRPIGEPHPIRSLKHSLLSERLTFY
jgi:hypothetical protein